MRSSTLITAASNFGVQYNYGCVTEALLWLRAIYYISESHPASTAVSTSVFYGTLLGMLSFGVIGDVLGRNEGMLLTLSIQAVAALLSSLAIAWNGSAEVIWWSIAACRGLIGVGCGWSAAVHSRAAWPMRLVRHSVLSSTCGGPRGAARGATR